MQPLMMMSALSNVRVRVNVHKCTTHRLPWPCLTRCPSCSYRTSAADVYSFGVLLWELYHGRTIIEAVEVRTSLGVEF